MNTILNTRGGILAGALLLGLIAMSSVAGENQPKGLATISEDAANPAPPQAPEPPEPPPQPLFLKSSRTPAEATWLGVGAEETSESLASQLELKPGEGLVVTFVSSNSPAAVAGLRKNDVLVELDGQMLVDSTQLRKLVQMHADGDSVKMVFYRAGKKESASAKLVKHVADEGFGYEGPGQKNLDNFLFRINDQHAFTWDNQQVHQEIEQAMKNAQIAMKSAQQAVQIAVQQSLDGTDGIEHKLEIIHKKLGNLADGGVNLDKRSTVVVKNDSEAVRTIVKKDETGTYVIVADPAKRLTVHDPDGKLLFDGKIDSTDEQEKVPKEVWAKVEPMLEQVNHGPTPRGKKPVLQRDSQDQE